MYLLASSMHRDAMSALAELNVELAKEVIKSDDEVDRFSLYVLYNLVMATQNGRVLREMGLKNPSDCLSYRAAVKSTRRWPQWERTGGMTRQASSWCSKASAGRQKTQATSPKPH